MKIIDFNDGRKIFRHWGTWYIAIPNQPIHKLKFREIE